MVGGLAQIDLVNGLVPSPCPTTVKTYDPIAGTTTQSPSTLTGHVFHTATLLGSGAVLVTGGDNGVVVIHQQPPLQPPVINQLGPTQSSAELYGAVAAGAPGATCANPGACLSGICNNGVCCAAACPNGGVCEKCVAGTGACAAVVNADDPDTCTGNQSCDATGNCKGAIGQACPGGAATCATGFCVDGFCCDTACNGLCLACAAALQTPGGGDGMCFPAKAQTNPHNDSCPVNPPSTCGHDGLCDGGGQCANYPMGTSCAASACIVGNIATGFLCDALSACVNDPIGVPCGNYLCTNGSCPFACASNADCIDTAQCTMGTCVPKPTQLANGSVCAGAGDCQSGICVDGVCCNAACAGQCEACDSAGAPGVCSAVSGAPHGMRSGCAGSGTTCGGQCDGVVPSQCAYPGATTSCGSSCTNDTQTSSHCDENGGCVAGASTDCPGGFACDGVTQCHTTCTQDLDCASGFGCSQGGSCTLKSASCASDCGLYACQAGVCAHQCRAATDCAKPNVCNASDECVPPGGAAAPNGGGCSLAIREPDGSSRTVSLWTALVIALAARRRRFKGRRAANRSSSPSTRSSFAGPRA